MNNKHFNQEFLKELDEIPKRYFKRDDEHLADEHPEIGLYVETSAGTAFWNGKYWCHSVGGIGKADVTWWRYNPNLSQPNKDYINLHNNENKHRDMGMYESVNQPHHEDDSDGMIGEDIADTEHLTQSEFEESAPPGGKKAIKALKKNPNHFNEALRNGIKRLK